MEFSIATLLAQFSDNKLVAGKSLEKRLGCQDPESSQKLQIVLDLLEKINVIAKERGKYRRVYEDDVVEAKLRCSSKGFCFAIQDNEGADDVYIRESHLSNAWNGDRVLVRVMKEGTRRRSPEGEVKVILERSNPSLLAKIKSENSEFQAVPLDDRLLFELELENQPQELKDAIDHLVHVEVKRYPLGQHPPIGEVTKILGSDAEAAADTDIVICKHDLPQRFSEEAVNTAKDLSPKFTAAEAKKRVDFTKLLTLALEESVETPIIETAYTLEKTETEHWQVGIHVTDVAHFVNSDSPLDRVARKRGTAIHLGDMMLPLFPPESLRCFSLVPGEERLTLSILLTINEAGDLVEFNLKPGVIMVDHLLSYQEAQSFLGRHEESETVPLKAVEMLNNLFFSLCPTVKAKRQQRGGFEVEALDRTLPFKDEGRLGAIAQSSALPIRSLLTELVVVAGQAIASHIQALGIPGLYCTQPVPDLEELDGLLKLASNLDINVDIDTDEAEEEAISPHDYQKLTQAFSQAVVSRVLSYLLQETLKIARYSTKPGKHFSLGYDEGYTHFAAPAQRYGDLLIQRILMVVFTEGRDRRHARTKKGIDLGSNTAHGNINWNVLPPATQTKLEEEIHGIVPHLNDREKLAEDAEKDLEGLRKAEKMKERTGQIFTGLITGVQSYGFFVEIEDLLVEGLVHVSSLKDDWYEYRARYSCLVGRKNRTAYRLGDRVDVQVKSVDYYRQQIDLVTVGGGSEAGSEVFEDN
jgi:ribonuclease R